MPSAIAGLGFAAPIGASTARPVAATPPQVSFDNVMKDIASSTLDAVKNSEAVASMGIRGQVATQDVVQALMQAEQSLQAAIAIRDKVVAAYNELTRMTI